MENTKNTRKKTQAQEEQTALQTCSRQHTHEDWAVCWRLGQVFRWQYRNRNDGERRGEKKRTTEKQTAAAKIQFPSEIKRSHSGLQKEIWRSQQPNKQINTAGKGNKGRETGSA